MRWESKVVDWADWHRWFAWFPVQVGERRVWLETIERRGKFLGFCLGDEVWKWEYR